MKDWPVRKGVRLSGYDYSQAGCYFITVCVKEGHELLGKTMNGQPVLNENGLVVKREIENISTIRKECAVHNFVIMPNHIHLIIQMVGDDGNRPAGSRGEQHAGSKTEQHTGSKTEQHAGSKTEQHAGSQEKQRADCHPPLRRSISNMVQGLKGAVTRQIGFSFWQRSYHDHIIRNETEYQRIWQYIDENPARWDMDQYHPHRATSTPV